MQNGDYDGIIIAYSCFESIHLSNEYVMNKISSEIKRIQEDLDALKTHTAVDDVPITRLQEYIKTTLGSLITSTATDAVTFDSLEINTIFLDEAHNYKNVPIKTHLKNIRGINPAGSKKCLDMLEKVRCVQAQNGGRGGRIRYATLSSARAARKSKSFVIRQLGQDIRPPRTKFRNRRKYFLVPHN